MSAIYDISQFDNNVEFYILNGLLILTSAATANFVTTVMQEIIPSYKRDLYYSLFIALFFIFLFYYVNEYVFPHYTISPKDKNSSPQTTPSSPAQS
jgi:hypothetical protein